MNYQITNLAPPTIDDTMTWSYINHNMGYNARVAKNIDYLQIESEDGSSESINREDLIKYIGEQKLIRENELVRQMYDRYQMAIKLVRSDDNDHTGV